MATDYVEDYEDVTGLSRDVIETKVIVPPAKPEVAPAKVAKVKATKAE